MEKHRCRKCNKVIAIGESEVEEGHLAIIKAAKIGIKCRYCDTITYLGYSGNMIEKFFNDVSYKSITK
jgi:phage FluMu protein Com